MVLRRRAGVARAARALIAAGTALHVRSEERARHQLDGRHRRRTRRVHHRTGSVHVLRRGGRAPIVRRNLRTLRRRHAHVRHHPALVLREDATRRPQDQTLRGAAHAVGCLPRRNRTALAQLEPARRARGAWRGAPLRQAPRYRRPRHALVRRNSGASQRLAVDRAGARTTRRLESKARSYGDAARISPAASGVSLSHCASSVAVAASGSNDVPRGTNFRSVFCPRRASDSPNEDGCFLHAT